MKSKDNNYINTIEESFNNLNKDDLSVGIYIDYSDFAGFGCLDGDVYSERLDKWFLFSVLDFVDGTVCVDINSDNMLLTKDIINEINLFNNSSSNYSVKYVDTHLQFKVASLSMSDDLSEKVYEALIKFVNDDNFVNLISKTKTDYLCPECGEPLYLDYNDQDKYHFSCSKCNKVFDPTIITGISDYIDEGELDSVNDIGKPTY